MAIERAPWHRSTGTETTAVVGAQLELAVALDPRWHLLPARAGEEVDGPDRPDRANRLLVGPGGAFVVRARELDGARVYVQGDALWADGERLDDLDRCAEEVDRTQRALAAEGTAIPVGAVFVPLDVRELAVAVQPPRAHVLPRSRLVNWLASRPEHLERSAVDAVRGAAIHRRSALRGA